MIIKVLGAVLCGVGLTWILQGVGVLPGSFMTGQIVWAAIGGVALIAGLVMLTIGRRGQRRSGSDDGGGD
ncbi:MAG: hypothetical protein Q8Q88_16915 [Phenylobacterium sp.]|uniref:hypothetical protein n=1 Tax=Phenylobacterium sp. TaxID=1871053 RepID=UPI002735DEA9|nr:hypothetical protein [Phenylobacterium sp.]MDP3748723.1 hypothetical protein [Phenylobacterium sp.]